jgi:glycine oxidase
VTVVVVGGGIIGRAIAWRAAAAGRAVTVVDGGPSGAWQVAAGMLAPVLEAAYGEEELLRLAIASNARWPAFAAELAEDAGVPTGYEQGGTLLVGRDGDDLAALRDVLAFQRELGLDVTPLRRRECRVREPQLSPGVRGGILAHDDHRADPRQVVAALRTAGTHHGVRDVVGHVTAVTREGSRVTGVTLDDGGHLAAAQVVLAAGRWTAAIEGLPATARIPVRPVKGQLLVLRAADRTPALTATVRGLVRGREVYLVPRADGRLIVGATEEERGDDVTVTAGAVRQLLDDATDLVPAVDEHELLETIAGLRPGTPDGRPLIGPTELDGLLVATGHHRGGVLLAPITAEAVTCWLTDRTVDPVLAVAAPDRPGLHAPTAHDQEVVPWI